MTDQKEIIIKAIIYEIIIAARDKGIEASLTADNLLANMAVPITQYDFTYANKYTLKKIFFAVDDFLKSSQIVISSYTKAELKSLFETLWVPNLSEKEKRDLIAEFRIIDGFDKDGYIIFNEKTFNSWKEVFSKDINIPRLEYKNQDVP